MCSTMAQQHFNFVTENIDVQNDDTVPEANSSLILQRRGYRGHLFHFSEQAFGGLFREVPFRCGGGGEPCRAFSCPIEGALHHYSQRFHLQAVRNIPNGQKSGRSVNDRQLRNLPIIPVSLS